MNTPYPINRYRFDQQKLKYYLKEYRNGFEGRCPDLREKLVAIKSFNENWEDFPDAFDKMLTDSMKMAPKAVKKEVEGQINAIIKLAKQNPDIIEDMFLKLMNHQSDLKSRLYAFENEAQNIWNDLEMNGKLKLNGKSIILYLWLRNPETYFPYLWHEVDAVYEKFATEGTKLIYDEAAITKNTVTAQGFFHDLCQEIIKDKELIEMVENTMRDHLDSCYFDGGFHALTYDFAEYIYGLSKKKKN